VGPQAAAARARGRTAAGVAIEPSAAALGWVGAREGPGNLLKDVDYVFLDLTSLLVFFPLAAAALLAGALLARRRAEQRARAGGPAARARRADVPFLPDVRPVRPSKRPGSYGPGGFAGMLGTAAVIGAGLLQLRAAVRHR
jgi:hypothetical protein